MDTEVVALPQVAEVRTTCPYCGVGCGLRVRADGAQLKISPDPDHPANFGRICTKGAALGETLDLDDRLLYPQIRGRRASWGRALTEVAEGFSQTIARHGPDSVAFYVSGQMLTEDYYVANKLMKGFVGSANIDTNSRLCMSSAVAGHVRAFGEDVVPVSYDDLEQSDLVVLVGSNAVWCHPVVFSRIRDAREKRPEMRIVVIDPRRTATAEEADLHLPLRAGSDVALFNGLLAHLVRSGHVDRAFVGAHTERLEETLLAAGSDDIATVARQCDVDETLLAKFFAWFAATPRTITLFSQGVNQSRVGTDKVNAIINCHLATGRINQPGAGPFSITGQPNAMGGREVGGLANTLAAHIGFDDAAGIDTVRRFWGAPNLARRPGLKAVDLFAAVRAGRVKAVWIMATNPLVSMPDADEVKKALAGCELVVVSDCVARNDTLAYAHIALPAAAWGEKDGTVTNSERRISRQRAFLPLPGEAKPDWWIVSEVARRMGFGAAFAYRNAAEVFREHARLSAFENHGRRWFDLGALAELDDAGYERMTPVRWPAPATAHDGRDVAFSGNRFTTPTGRARFVPTPVRERPQDAEGRDLSRRSTGDLRDPLQDGKGHNRLMRSPGEAGDLSRDVQEQDFYTPRAMITRETGDLSRDAQEQDFYTPRAMITRETGDLSRDAQEQDFYIPRAMITRGAGDLSRDVQELRYPFTLNTGRLRDHWHTMTRTGKSPRLSAHIAEPFVAVHPDDAQRDGLVDNGLASVRTQHGNVLLRVKVDAAQRRGDLFVPIHWNDQTASQARVGALVHPLVDPISGEPDFKATPAAIRAWPAAWHGFLMCRDAPRIGSSLGIDYWLRVRGRGHWRVELAGRERQRAWTPWARRLLGAVRGDADWLEYTDPRGGGYRLAHLDRDGQLLACLFVASDPQLLPSREWLGGLFGLASVHPGTRAALLAGRDFTDVEHRIAL